MTILINNSLKMLSYKKCQSSVNIYVYTQLGFLRASSNTEDLSGIDWSTKSPITWNSLDNWSHTPKHRYVNKNKTDFSAA